MVSGQNRKRLYWTNIPNVTVPEDRNIKLNDVVDFSKESFRPVSDWVWKKWGDKKKIEMLHDIHSKKSHTLTTSATHILNTTTYCQYGFTYRKQTDFLSNIDLHLKPPCKNGSPCHEKAPRGSKTGLQAITDPALKSLYPKELCKHIVNECEKYCGINNLRDGEKNDKEIQGIRQGNEKRTT